MDESDFNKKEYKEFLVHGELVGKWVSLYDVSEYNQNGELIYKTFWTKKFWYNYDSHGNCIFEKQEWWVTTEDENGVYYIDYDEGPDIQIYTNELKYDQKGNLIYKEHIDIKESKCIEKYFFEYDSSGKKTKERHERRKDLYTYHYTYDEQGRLIRRDYEDGNRKIRGALEFEYDDCGRVVCERGSHGDHKVLYEYDENGNKSYMNVTGTDGMNDCFLYTYELWDNGKPRKRFKYIAM